MEAAESATPTAVAPAAAAPTLVECIYGGGAWTENGWLSDGSYGYHPECAARRSEQLARNPYRCPQTDHYVADPSECLYPMGVSVPSPPEPQNPSSVETVEETDEEADEPDAPPVEQEYGDEPGAGDSPGE